MSADGVSEALLLAAVVAAAPTAFLPPPPVLYVSPCCFYYAPLGSRRPPLSHSATRHHRCRCLSYPLNSRWPCQTLVALPVVPRESPDGGGNNMSRRKERKQSVVAPEKRRSPVTTGVCAIRLLRDVPQWAARLVLWLWTPEREGSGFCRLNARMLRPERPLQDRTTPVGRSHALRCLPGLVTDCCDVAQSTRDVWVVGPEHCR